MISCYIAGPYTADTKEQVDKHIDRAAEAASYYYKRGYAVYCPHLQTSYIDRHYNQGEELEYNDWMRNDIYWLEKCDVIVFLPGWEKSKGAKIERLIAEAMGKSILEWEPGYRKIRGR